MINCFVLVLDNNFIVECFRTCILLYSLCLQIFKLDTEYDYFQIRIPRRCKSDLMIDLLIYLFVQELWEP